MRVLYLGNNWLGWQVLQWLRQEGEEIAGLVVHPPGGRKCGDEIIQSAGLDAARIFDGSQLRQSNIIEAIRNLKPEIGLSVLFGYILRREFLNLMPAGCVNVHPALLPYNRGAYPNVWSIIEGTPAGVTIHYIDQRVDTGDLIAHHPVVVEPVDTGESLYRKLEHAAFDLFKETWPLISSGQVSRMPQNKTQGTHHFVRDVERIDEIDLARMYNARELIDVIRARTFSPYPGAYFRHDGRKVYLRLQLFYEEQLKGRSRNDEVN